MNVSAFHLKVQRIEQVCVFDLSWSKGQHLNVTLPYPQNLTVLYQEWQQIYLTFYKTALRGKVAETGVLLRKSEQQKAYDYVGWALPTSPPYRRCKMSGFKISSRLPVDEKTAFPKRSAM